MNILPGSIIKGPRWPEANRSDADNAFDQAHQILKAILADFELRGIKL